MEHCAFTQSPSQISPFSSVISPVAHSVCLNESYTVNAVSRNPASRVIGLILGDVRNLYYSEIIFHLQNIFFQHNYMLMQFTSLYNEDRELEFLEFCEQANFAGLILLSALDSKVLQEKIEALPFPVIVLNRFIKNFDGYTIVQDNFKCGYLAATHLLELGHPRIAFLAGPQNSTSSMRRLEGFRQAMQNCYIPIEESEIYYGDLTIDNGIRIGSHYLKDLPQHPKAIIIGNDLMSIGFLEACDRAHVTVPDQLSIVSFDDISFSALQRFSLTTVRQPIEDMCEAAATALLNAIFHPDCAPYRTILAPKLVVRSTTCQYQP